MRQLALVSGLVSTALLVSGGIATAASQSLTPTSLPNLVGGGSNSAAAINEDGWIVGWATTAAGAQHAVVWANGAVVDLGTLPGDTSSYATAISADGLIVGVSGVGALAPFDPANESSHAVLWRDGAIIDLGTLPGGTFSVAAGVNDAGQVVGASRAFDSVLGGTAIRGFLWQGGQMTELEPLLASSQTVSTSSDAMAINSHGQIVGTAASFDSATGLLARHAVTWTDGVVDDLGALAGDRASGALAINGAGQIVGASGDPEAGLGLRAVKWTGSRVKALDPLPAETFSVATALNGRGLIVGQCAVGGSLRGCLWQARSVAQLLPVSGDLYSTALGINDDGLAVGYSQDGSFNFHAVTWARE